MTDNLATQYKKHNERKDCFKEKVVQLLNRLEQEPLDYQDTLAIFDSYNDKQGNTEF